jgi:hypothetical protein
LRVLKVALPSMTALSASQCAAPDPPYQNAVFRSLFLQEKATERSHFLINSVTIDDFLRILHFFVKKVAKVLPKLFTRDTLYGII